MRNSSTSSSSSSSAPEPSGRTAHRCCSQLATEPAGPPTAARRRLPAGLRRWLRRCDIRDEQGRPVHLTPHQWRHTLGTRLINRDVPQEVVRRILDHDSQARQGVGGPQGRGQAAARHRRQGRPGWPR
ncbi:tyrosine-type recombinase/integrase [Streptosporangium sp. NPDC005286]|uniref:tyrosine-type recombinase/integrase n=1 Tax=Streptosporangium sp. NPDC005286 TaxID=3154463 RepID=UPI0033A18C26